MPATHGVAASISIPGEAISHQEKDRRHSGMHASKTNDRQGILRMGMTCVDQGVL